MKVLSIAMFLFFAVSSISNTALYAQEKEDIIEDIRDVLKNNIKAGEERDMDALLATYHTQSPAYTSIKKVMEPVFENYELKYTNTYFDYIGKTGEYVVVREKYRTEKITGPYFNNNETDMVHILKQENGEWKIWASAVLGLKFLN